MKKVIISSVVALALVLVGSVSSASAATFSNYLTVGSTGSDVVNLQSFLVSKGFLTMPAGVSEGYFGSLTKAAVIAYQTNAGIVPQSGFVGPLTIASLNNAMTGTMTTTTTTTTGGTTAFTCPVGWSCTGPATTATTGTTVTTTTSVPAGTIATPGVSGTLNIAKGSFTGNGTTVNDGQAVDVASFDLQAGASDQLVSSVDFDFSVRPWLYVSSFSVYNAATGATIATVSNLTAANFTELIVGSEYRLTIPASILVKAGTKTTIVLHAQFATSNRAITNIYVTRAEVRSVDGTGVTTTESIGDGISTANGLNLFVDYGGQNNTNIITTIDPSSPNTGIIQTNTGTTQTQNVLLGVFDLKSQNINSTLQSLTANVNMSGVGSVGSVFANIQLKTGSTLLTSGTIISTGASTSAVTFTNFNLPLPSNVYVPVSIYATISGGVSGVSASTSILVNAADIGGIDANSNPLVLSGETAGSVSTPNTVLPSANQTFIASGVSLTNLTWSQPQTAGSDNNGLQKFTNFSGSFTVTAGSNPVYISNLASLAFATTTNIAGATSTISNFSVSNGNQSYDNTATNGTGYYQITPGSSRTFTVTGTINNGSGTQANVSSEITQVNFGTAPSAPFNTLPINFLLQGLNSDGHIATLLGTAN
jgi:hypothetical protein